MKRYELYYLNDFNDRYPAFSKESPDGEWVSFEDVEELKKRIDGFLNAYPVDLFPEPTKEQYAEAHQLLEQIRPGFGSALHGSWGRHIARCIADSLGAISDD